MATSLQQLLASPDRYFHSFEGEDGIFVPMDKAAYVRSIFLDRRISPAATGGWRIPVSELAEAAPPSQTIRWIFHVAHCGSTLLARALEALTGDLVLKEPQALRQAGLAPDRERTALVLSLLSRRYPGQGPVLVKANVPVNFILDHIAAAQLDAPAILLHLGLEDYLVAILRSPNHRAWVRNVTGLLAAHLGDTSALEDAECAAALWLAMQRRFAAALAKMPHARSLDAERFFAEPAATLAAAAALFGMEARAERIAQVATGPLFASYSKNPAVAFDNAARVARREALVGELAGELRVAKAWVERSAPDAPVLSAHLAAASLVA